jgi:hypothetical protein
VSAFDKYFSEVSGFSDGSLVVSGKQSIESAAEMFSEYLDEDVSVNAIRADRVRYGFAPEDVIDMQGEACWYTGATGKGSMPVWVLG